MLVVYIRVCISMYVMDGCLEGLPKVLNNTSYDVLKSQDGYLIRVKLIKLSKYLDFPLTSRIDEETGVIYVINEMGHDIIYIYIYILTKLG